MKALVTGGAGFIGSTLVDRLLADGDTVIAYDNFSTGMREFLVKAEAHSRFCLIEGDLMDTDRLQMALDGVDFVFHMAANADIRGGLTNPRLDLEQNIIGTLNVLEAMRRAGVKRIAFASSSAIYGNAAVIPTPEDVALPHQISLYGTSKAAGEGFITSYCEGFGIQAWIFRFVSVLGERYTHGHVFDFIKKLRETPESLEILGDGRQRKSYMHVKDCVNAIILACNTAKEKWNIFNLGLDNFITVTDSAKIICERMRLTPEFRFTGGERGWIGDSPFIWLDPKRIMAQGWQPKRSIAESVQATVDWLLANEWVLDRR